MGSGVFGVDEVESSEDDRKVLPDERMVVSLNQSKQSSYNLIFLLFWNMLQFGCPCQPIQKSPLIKLRIELLRIVHGTIIIHPPKHTPQLRTNLLS
jgi:hypothetical protein